MFGASREGSLSNSEVPEFVIASLSQGETWEVLTGHFLPEASSSNRNAWVCPQCRSLRQHGTLCRDRLFLNCSCPAALQKPAEAHCCTAGL